MPRVKIEGVAIGCPVANNDGAPCPRCGGNWPGTKATSQQLFDAVKKGRIVDPRLFGCLLLEEQVIFLIQYFARINNCAGRAHR